MVSNPEELSEGRRNAKEIVDTAIMLESSPFSKRARRRLRQASEPSTGPSVGFFWATQARIEATLRRTAGSSRPSRAPNSSSSRLVSVSHSEEKVAAP